MWVSNISIWMWFPEQRAVISVRLKRHSKDSLHWWSGFHRTMIGKWMSVLWGDFTFSVMSSSQESMLSLNKSSVLPWLLLRLLLWSSCLLDPHAHTQKQEQFNHRIRSCITIRHKAIIFWFITQNTSSFCVPSAFRSHADSYILQEERPTYLSAQFYGWIRLHCSINYLQTTLPILHHCTHPFYESTFNACASLGALRLQAREGTDQQRHYESWSSARSSPPTHTEPKSTRLKDTCACAGMKTILLSHLH